MTDLRALIAAQPRWIEYLQEGAPNLDPAVETALIELSIDTRTALDELTQLGELEAQP